jgi:hypothetical protein
MKASRALVVTMLPIVLIAGTALARQQIQSAEFAPVLNPAAASRATNRTEQSHSTTIQLPAGWVPFSATIVSTDPAGNVQYGKLYRSSDGSNTTIMQSTDGTPIVTIHHFPTRQTFARLRKQGWMVYPFASKKSILPKRTLTAAASRLRKLDVIVAGAPVYELIGRVKRTRWAVGLNGFPVYTLDSNGSTFELVDIAVGEPPADVFMPPPDAKPVRMARDDVFGEAPPLRR